MTEVSGTRRRVRAWLWGAGALGVLSGAWLTVEVLDNRLDGVFGHIPGWYGEVPRPSWLRLSRWGASRECLGCRGCSLRLR